MNIGTGIFTTPRNGTYSFAFTAVAYCLGDGYVTVQLLLNGQAVNYGHAHGLHDKASMHTTLHLQASDQVWTQVLDASNCSMLERQWLHFTGWQLQEELTF